MLIVTISPKKHEKLLFLLYLSKKSIVTVEQFALHHKPLEFEGFIFVKNIFDNWYFSFRISKNLILDEQKMYTETNRDIMYLLTKLSQDECYFPGFASPTIYVLLKTYAKENNIDLNSYTFDNNVYEFLKRLNFFDDQHEIKSPCILPIRTITSQETQEIDRTTNLFSELLKKITQNTNDNLMKNIEAIIAEMLNNIDNHSGKPDKDNPTQVYISANYQSWQFYKNAKCIQIVVADAWIGILASVRRKVQEIQKTEDAIKKALEPKFTWGTRLNNSWHSNAWMGLTTTLEAIKQLEWDLFIGTKDCLFSYNGRTWEEKYETIPPWKGTFVIFNIYTDTDTNIDFSDIKRTLMQNDEIFDFEDIFW